MSSLTPLDYSLVANLSLSNVIGLRFSPDTNLFYGVGWSSALSQEHFLSAEPATGLLRDLGVIPGVSFISSGSNHLVGSNYFFVAAGQTARIAHLSTDTGALMSSLTPLDYSLVANLSLSNVIGLRFSPDTNLFYGVGWSSALSQEHFLSAEPATGLLRDLGVIPGVSFISSGSNHLVGSNYFFRRCRTDCAHYPHLAASSFSFASHAAIFSSGNIPAFIATVSSGS